MVHFVDRYLKFDYLYLLIKCSLSKCKSLTLPKLYKLNVAKGKNPRTNDHNFNLKSLCTSFSLQDPYK